MSFFLNLDVCGGGYHVVSGDAFIYFYELILNVPVKHYSVKPARTFSLVEPVQTNEYKVSCSRILYHTDQHQTVCKGHQQMTSRLQQGKS